MLKNRKGRAIVATALAVVLLFTLTVATAPNAARVRAASLARTTALSAANWVAPSLYENGSRVTGMRLNDVAVEGSFDFGKGDVLRFTPDTALSGAYRIGMKFRAPADASAMDTLFSLRYNGEEYSALLPLAWYVPDEVYPTDRIGNEMVPEQACYPGTVFAALADKHHINLDEISLAVRPDGGELVLQNTTQTVTVEEVWLYTATETADYAAYREAITDTASAGDTLITVQGEDFSLKSDVAPHGININSAVLMPYDTYHRLINTLDGASWSGAGQKVMWEFEVPAAGWYELGFHYYQNAASNKKSYRTVEIDGKVPFAEMQAVAFRQTSSQKFVTEFLANDAGETYRFYLTPGRHTLAMTATMQPVIAVYDTLRQLTEEINTLSADVTKLTAGASDTHRTWDIEIYLPHALEDLRSFVERLNTVYEQLQAIEGARPTYADSLLYAVDLLQRLLKSPRTIPNNMQMLSTGDSSALKYISTVITNLTRLSLGFDEIYFKSAGTDFHPYKTSVRMDAANAAKRLAYSLTPEATGRVSADQKKRALQVWMSRSSIFVQTLQGLIDADERFSDCPVDLSIMPSDQKLVLAAASGTAPDAVIGVNYAVPFKFAVRGAAKDLTEFPDFLPSYNREYNLTGLIPCCYDGGVYGAVETQDYYVLFYRRDILNTLGIRVPETWDDVEAVIPTLLRYNKNISLPIANCIGYKSFSTTSPYIYQNGGDFYHENGAAVAFMQPATVAGFSKLTDLFRIYAVDEYVASFYNAFRSGDCPMGIGTVSMYVQLSEAAPELAGLWDIAPAPGVKQPDGSLLRYHNAASTTCMIFQSSKRQEEAWQFLKWWLSSEIQSRFGAMMESAYGTEYRWNTANLKAFDSTSYPEEHKEVIRTMWRSQRETVQHPASYLVEREISNAFTNVTVNGKTVIDSLENSSLLSNREITRKLQEFGFCDENGELLREYPVRVMEQLTAKLREQEGTGG